MPRLSLTQLTTLREFSRRGTLAAAADRLGYTPGAVSQHMDALERSVGVALTERCGRRLLLTDAGRLLAEHAERILDAEAEAVGAIRSGTQEAVGGVVVGTWGSTAASLLAPVVALLGEEFAEMSLRSREIDVDAAVSAVGNGQVDAAFGLDYADAPMGSDDAVTIVPLHAERFAIATAGRDGEPDRRPVEIEELASRDWILAPEDGQYGRALRLAFRRRGFEPRVVHEVTDTAASLQLAAAGAGVTPMTDLMRRMAPALRLQALEPAEPIERRLILVVREGADARPTIRALTEVVRRVVGEVLGAEDPDPFRSSPARPRLDR